MLQKLCDVYSPFSHSNREAKSKIKRFSLQHTEYAVWDFTPPGFIRKEQSRPLLEVPGQEANSGKAETEPLIEGFSKEDVQSHFTKYLLNNYKWSFFIFIET